MPNETTSTSFLDESLTIDDREPILTFELPVVGGTYGLIPERNLFVLDLLGILLFQISIGASIGLIMNKFVSKHSRIVGNDTTSFLIAFGILFPFLLRLPFWLIEMMNLRSVAMRLSVGTIALTIPFRILEDIFGFTPPGPKKSLRNFILYYCTLMDVKYDKLTNEPLVADFKYLKMLVTDHLVSKIIVSILLSLTISYDFAPFETRVGAETLDHGFWDLFAVGHLLNNYLAACVVSVQLAFGTTGAQLIPALLFGVQTEKVMKSPMVKSTSPSDFWGRRWNSIVHSSLKGGIFKPVRKHFSKPIAAFATFVASGLMHEFNWVFLFYVLEQDRNIDGYCIEKPSTSCYYPIYGKTSLFFIWNGCVIVLESLIGHWSIFRWIGANVPRPIVAMLVVMTALPVGHLFTGDWIAGKYFDHLSLGFPMVVPLTNKIR